MARTEGGADRLLIEAAKEIASHTGCSGLRIRDVASRAGVNLGMFHYHFKSKKRFTRAVLQALYDDFFASLSLAAREDGSPLEQLRASLVVMGCFIRDQRHLVGGLWKDVLNSDAEVLAFVGDNVPRHAAVIRRLLLRCRKEGLLPPIPFIQAIGYLMGGLNVPTVVAGRLERAKVLPEGGFKGVLSDRAVQQRVDMLLAGLKEWRP